MSEQTSQPRRRRERDDQHEKWDRLDERRRRIEAAAKRRDDEQEEARRRHQSRLDQAEVETMVAAGPSEGGGRADILAGASEPKIEHAGSRAVRPVEIALAGYVARKIVTTRGYEAVAYYLYSEPNRPALIDYGDQLSAYGAVTPEDHRVRAAAMIEIGTQKGWNTRRFWGSEEWLKATYIEARRAGLAWCVDQQRSAYVPDAATLAAWDKEAKAEAATAEQGASDGDGTSYTTEKAVDDKTEIQAAEESKDNPYAGWSRQQMLDRLTHLRRKHGCEFEDDDEQDREGPSYGA